VSRAGKYRRRRRDEKAEASIPAPTQARPPVDFHALVEGAAAAAVRGVEQQRREAEDARRRGGPCEYCGTRSSDEWRTTSRGVACLRCTDDMSWYSTDADRRHAVLCRLFTPFERQGWVGQALVERAALPWFREVLTGTDGTPWSYVTPTMRAAVTERLRPSDAAVPAHDEHCSVCGCGTAWRYGTRPASAPTTRRVDAQTRPMLVGRDLNEVDSVEVPGVRPTGVEWWCDGCRTRSVREAAARLTPELRDDLLGARPDQGALNRAGVVEFRHTDAVTRTRHDAARPYSWLDPVRIRANVPGVTAASVKARMRALVG
jgi:hypothetical protein